LRRESSAKIQNPATAPNTNPMESALIITSGASKNIENRLIPLPMPTIDSRIMKKKRNGRGNQADQGAR
jgi:hypothetical protein